MLDFGVVATLKYSPSSKMIEPANAKRRSPKFREQNYLSKIEMY
jgi:hypothetical protein